MKPLTLLLSGLGFLVLGLLFALGLDGSPGEAGARSEVVKAYAANACSLLGVGLLVVAAYLRATARQAPPAASTDHYA